MNGHCWSLESQPEIFVSPEAAPSHLLNSWENALFTVSSALAVGTQRENMRFCGLHLFLHAFKTLLSVLFQGSLRGTPEIGQTFSHNKPPVFWGFSICCFPF